MYMNISYIAIYNIYIYSAIACDRIGIIGRTDNQ